MQVYDAMEDREDEDGRKVSFGFLLAPHFTLIAFSGFLEILRHAADLGDQSRQRLCSWTVMGAGRDPVTASAGVQVIPWETFRDPQEFDYIVIVGGLRREIDHYDRHLLAYLQAAGSAGVSLIGLCTGSFYLARAGLMHRRKCCIHWYHFQDFTDEFPDTFPVTDEIFIVDGDRITCPGGASAIDLALYLVERHLGRHRAVKCLRHQLLDWVRPHDHPQSPFTQDFTTVSDPRVRKAVYLMEQSLGGETLSVDHIAAKVNTSIRQLERMFHTHFGRSPLSVFREIRLNYGRWLLVNSDRSITEIAYECGFSDSSHFSRWFKSAFGQAPAAARRSGAGLASHRIKPGNGQDPKRSG
jgi:transcriptional regulator GlxA family with amidase domain